MSQALIHDWIAARSGATITVYGKTREGAPVRLTHVLRIGPDKGQIVATREDGTRHPLALA